MEVNKTNISNIIDIVYLTPENAEFSLSENGFLQLKAKVKNPENKQSDKTDKTDKDSGINDSENENEDNIPIEEFFFERVFLHRAFPFDNPFEYISVSGAFPKKDENKETKEDKTDTTEEKETKEKEGDSPAPLSDSKTEKAAEPKENTTSFGDLKEIGIISNISVFGETERQYLIDELKRKYFIPVIETIYAVKEKYGFSYWEVKTNVGKIKFTVNDAYRNILKVTEDRIIVTDVNGNRYEIISLDGLDRPSFRRIELFL